MYIYIYTSKSTCPVVQAGACSMRSRRISWVIVFHTIAPIDSIFNNRDPSSPVSLIPSGWL